MSSGSKPAGPGVGWLIVLGTAALAGAAAGPHLFDAGELVAAAWLLGGSHAPGQPLHALLGHACSLVPLGPGPWRITFVSVAGVMAGAWCVGRLASLLARAAGVPPSGWTRVLPGVAALGVVLSPPVLRQATRPEVYGLAFGLFGYGALELTRWMLEDDQGRSALRRAGLAAGLAAAVHPPHAAALVLLGLAGLLAGPRTGFPPLAGLAWTGALCALGAATYLYLPLRALAGADMWGDPTTLGGFVDYLAAKAYQSKLGSAGSPVTLVTDAARYVASAAAFVPVVGVLAWVLVTRSARELPRHAARYAALGSLLTMAVACLQPHEPHNPDNVAYALPSVCLWIAAGSAGWMALAHRWPRRWPIALVLLPVALPPLGLAHLPSAARADLPALETLTGMLADSPPSRALVIVETDFVAGSWMQARAIDGARPDVALLATGLSTSSWHWRSLTKHPLFDGRPVRGHGRSARERYTNGAVARARRGVAVASEPSAPLGGGGAVAGPYLVQPAAGRATRSVHRASAGERLMMHFDRETARGPSGDRGTAHAIARHVQLERVTRLLGRGEADSAWRSAARALWWLPRGERDAIRHPEISGRPTPPVPLVQDPTGFSWSRDEAARQVAVLLWSAGAPATATGLLDAQLARGDDRALLQLAWLYAQAGEPGQAQEARDQFLRRLPAAAAEVEGLSRYLRRRDRP